MEILVLHRQGMGIKAIARKLGVSRNTVRKYLQTPNQLPTYSTRQPRRTKLSDYQDFIKQRVDQAKPDWIPGTVILREIQELGYSGGMTQLRVFLAPLKPKPTPEPLVRFETEPGQQLQVDFTIIRRGDKPLKALVATLGFSRATFVRFYDNERSESWLDGIKQAFDYFGGVTKTVLFDNAKSIILERDAYGEGNHRWNPALLDLSKAYGFSIKVCRPYRAKTKGKVERFNHYLKNSFITPLNASFRSQGLMLDVASANGKIGAWLDTVANTRIHATTGQQPTVLLEKERHDFLPLPVLVNEPITSLVTNNLPMPFESIQHPMAIYDACIPRMAA